jgi:hypothetical protein
MRLDFLQYDILTEDPESPEEGMMWYNTTAKRFKRYVDGAIKLSADTTDMGGSSNLDGGKADTNFGGIVPIDGGSA